MIALNLLMSMKKLCDKLGIPQEERVITLTRRDIDDLCSSVPFAVEETKAYVQQVTGRLGEFLGFKFVIEEE